MVIRSTGQTFNDMKCNSWRLCPECGCRMIDTQVEAECAECRELTKSLLVNTSYTLIVILIMIVIAVLVGTSRAHGSSEAALLNAIRDLESKPGRSDNGRAHGEFQMHAAAFRDVQAETGWRHDISILRSPYWSREYARRYLRILSHHLASGGHDVSPTNLWVAWNLGPTRFLRARGFSFTNLPKRTAEGVNYINAKLKQ